MRMMRDESKRNDLLSDDATAPAATIGIDGDVSLGCRCRLGLGDGGEEVEERIHLCVKR